MNETPLHATLTIVSGPGTNTVITLPQDELVLGRIEPAGLVINHPEVSRRHARIIYHEGSYYLEDLGSVNGTLLNGQVITGEYLLKSGDEIMIGTEVKIRFAQPQPEMTAVKETDVTNITDATEHEVKSTDTGKTMFDESVDLSVILKSAGVTKPKLRGLLYKPRSR